MFKKIIYLVILVLTFLPCLQVYANETEETVTNEESVNNTKLELNAQSAILIDADTGRVLYEKNGYNEMPMASTTKIMTCIVALENGNLSDVVKISSHASSMPDVQLNVRAEEEYKLEDLLYSLMLESHNDVAVAIAEHIGGSVEGFAELMNKKAQDIGAFHSNFVTPNGLDADTHYSTAYDMALIGAYAIKNDEFIKITNTKSYTFSSIDGSRSFSVANKDAFLSQMEGAIGIKTGYTSKAGFCFVGGLKKDNRTFISVVLASGWPPNKSFKWSDTRKLMLYGLENYTYKVLFEPIKSYKKITINNGQKSIIDTYIDGSFSVLISQFEQAKYIYKLPGDIEAPIKKDQIIGLIEITIDNETVWSYPIKAKESVKKIDFKFNLKKVIDKYIV